MISRILRWKLTDGEAGLLRHGTRCLVRPPRPTVNERQRTQYIGTDYVPSRLVSRCVRRIGAGSV